VFALFHAFKYSSVQASDPVRRSRTRRRSFRALLIPPIRKSAMANSAQDIGPVSHAQKALQEQHPAQGSCHATAAAEVNTLVEAHPPQHTTRCS
jgi:hypothetical protein